MQSAPKDSGLALIIEIVGGLFGFLGLGYLYAGLTSDGLIRLIGWWVFIGVAVVLTILTAGLGAFCFGPFGIGVPIASGIMLKNRLDKVM